MMPKLKDTAIKILLSYLLFTYGIQLFSNRYKSNIKNIWNEAEPGFFFYLSLVVFVIVAYGFTINFDKAANVFSRLVRTIIVKLSLVYGKWIKVRPFFILIFTAAAILWIEQGLASYRYDGVTMGERLSPYLLIVVTGKLILFTDLWFYITLSINSDLGRIKYPLGIIVNIGLLLSLTGTTSALLYIIHSAIVFLPKASYRILTISIATTLFKNPVRSFLLILSSVVMILGFAYAYHYGEIIKTGHQMTMAERYTSDESLKYLHWFFQQRFSTTLYGHTYLMSEMSYSLQDNLNHLLIPWDNFLYRIDVLAGKPFKLVKPDYATINQLNYDTLLISGKDKTSGASPGLIPTFIYIMPMWLAILVAGMVMSMFMTVIKAATPKGTLLYSSLSILLLLDLFKAFGESFNPISTTFIQLIFFLGIAGHLYQSRKHE